MSTEINSALWAKINEKPGQPWQYDIKYKTNYRKVLMELEETMENKNRLQILNFNIERAVQKALVSVKLISPEAKMSTRAMVIDDTPTSSSI